MRAEQKRAFAPEFESDVLDEMSLVDNIINEVSTIKYLW